jgi:transposase-like protein
MKTSVAPAASAAPCCPTCGSAAIVKSGHNSVGTQQYLCKACGAHRVLAAKSRETEAARKALILQAVETERLSLRAAERLFGVTRQTVAKWLKKRPKGCRR